MAKPEIYARKPAPTGLRRIIDNLIMPALEAFAASRGSYRRPSDVPANQVVAKFERRRRPGTPTGRFDRALAEVSH